MRASRWAALMAGLALLVGPPVPPASAHQFQGKGWTYRSDGPCTYQWAALKHGGGRVGISARVDSWERGITQSGGTIRCVRPKTVPPRYLRVGMALIKEDGDRATVCRFVNYSMNNEGRDSLLIFESYEEKLCGPGTYLVQSQAAVLSNNEWHGGEIVSPTHDLGSN